MQDQAELKRHNDVLAQADAAAARLWAQAAAMDHVDADPAQLCAPLVESGLVAACLPVAFGGMAVASDERMAPTLAKVLRRVGGANLSAGRLFEGHVNAIKLVARYGTPEAMDSLFEDVRARGLLSGVWNAEGGGVSLTLKGGTLAGGKIYASGAGYLVRPMATARVEGAEGPQLLCLRLPGGRVNANLSGWRPQGMRATATATVDLTGMTIAPDEVVGAVGDYYRAPLFRAGAWRFCAVQLGAMERIVALLRSALTARTRGADPHQLARVGHAQVAVETARLWVSNAAAMAEGGDASTEDIEAYVNLTRTAVERTAMELIALAQRSVGLAALLEGDLDRVTRDLSTYLRQPFPDGALDDAARRLLAGPRPIHEDFA